jgi:hypothetical protein
MFHNIRTTSMSFELVRPGEKKICDVLGMRILSGFEYTPYYSALVLGHHTVVSWRGQGMSVPTPFSTDTVDDKSTD